MDFKRASMSENDLICSHNKNEKLPSRISSLDIFQENERIIIEHNGEEYILRITRSGKLILTK